MQVFSEQAFTYDEAERKAREKYGERLQIMMHETVKIPGGFLGFFPRDGVRITGFIPKFNQPVPPRDNQNKSISFAEEKEKVLAAANRDNANKDNAMKEVLAELKTIKERIESSGLSSSREEHPTLNRLDDLLIINDFTPAFRKTIFERVRKEISIDGLNDYGKVQDMVLQWIGENIKINENNKFNVKPRIMILVGPTGVGKTTTIAKLAANFGINFNKGEHKRRVVLVTIDEYRIGAAEQLKGYSDVMEFPCFSASDHDELKKIIALNSDSTDLILVDTIGKSPRDAVQLGEMKLFLDACGTLADVHLAVSATTKSSDITEILKTFEPFNYKSVIVTKMDETIRTGNIISALSEKAKAVSYITNGQKVPTDINKASVIQFLINLEGFKVNRARLEEKFPSIRTGTDTVV